MGQVLSHERKLMFRDADAVCGAEGNTAGCAIASALPVPRGLRPWHAVRNLLFGNREISCLAVLQQGAVRIGKAGGPKPMMHGHEKSDPAHSSDEAGEQRRATVRGVGGAKGRGRGEHGRARHAPDTEPGKHVPRAGSRTAGSKGEEAGTVHGPAASCRCRPAASRPMAGCGRRRRLVWMG